MPEKKKLQPRQKQKEKPGKEYKMTPKPEPKVKHQVGTGKLAGKVAIITGGDSGIGRAVAIAFAKEGASVSALYLNEHKDAAETKGLVEKEGGKCLLIAGDIGDEKYCREAVRQTIDEFGRLDIVVNNAAEQHPQEELQAITKEQLERTFRHEHFFVFLSNQSGAAPPEKGQHDYQHQLRYRLSRKSASA
jgi:NAD(P)-dependent dehydrogenase (short-subunit alcohol dehydrogenase family)